MFRMALLLVLVCASSASAQVYLQLVGAAQGPIEGEGTNEFLPNTIEVQSIQWGAGRAIGQGGTQPSPLSLGEVTISKQQDVSSLPLIRANGEGERMQVCRFYLFAGGATVVAEDDPLARRMPLPGEYLQIELTNAYVTSYSTSAPSDGTQSESVSFSYDRIRIFDASTGEGVTLDARGQAPRTLARGAVPESMPRAKGVFDFEVPDSGRIDVDIVDGRGHLVTRLFVDAVAREDGVLRWDATDEMGRALPPGEYTATVRTAETETIHRIVIGD